MKVKNMTGKNGRAIPNQFIITTADGKYFQSYSSVIVFVPNYPKAMQDDGTFGKSHTVLDKNDWDYSKTTGKYRNQFLDETKKETQAKINSGEYVLIDLN